MKKLIFLVFIITASTIYIKAQINPESRGLSGFRFMFYNVENLFDPFSDSLKNDESFTPDGELHWTWKKMERKIMHTAKVIIAAGGWELPAVIGLCEVENRFVVNRLAGSPIFRDAGYYYKTAHFESPDYRGIDVALLYRPEKVELLYARPIRVLLESDSLFRTRDILYAVFKTLYGDTINIFINHWPSRRGGAEASAYKRANAANTLRCVVDSLLEADTMANILIAGDFNDEPDDSSVCQVLRAVNVSDNGGSQLINLMFDLLSKGEGTHSYKELQGIHFGILDQIIVSSSLYYGLSGLVVNKAFIGRFPFLLQTNSAGIEVPFRTHAGPRYLGGFSDHLPVIVDIMAVQ